MHGDAKQGLNLTTSISTKQHPYPTLRVAMPERVMMPELGMQRARTPADSPTPKDSGTVKEWQSG